MVKFMYGMLCSEEKHTEEEHKRLLANNPTIQELTSKRVSMTLPTSVVKSLPPVPSLVGQGASGVFHPFTQSQSTATFSVVTDAEQQYLDAIVQHAEKQFIDISHHVQQEPLTFDGVREKIEIYRTHLQNGVIGSSQLIVADFLTVPPLQDPGVPLQFKSSKFKVVPSNQLSSTETSLMYNVTKLSDLFLSMKVADSAPLLVSFDV